MRPRSFQENSPARPTNPCTGWWLWRRWCRGLSDRRRRRFANPDSTGSPSTSADFLICPPANKPDRCERCRPETQDELVVGMIASFTVYARRAPAGPPIHFAVIVRLPGVEIFWCCISSKGGRLLDRRALKRVPPAVASGRWVIALVLRAVISSLTSDNLSWSRWAVGWLASLHALVDVAGTPCRFSATYIASP